MKDVHSLIHRCASIPEGPAAPVMRMAGERIVAALIDSKMTGWGSMGGDCRIQLGSAGWLMGCLLISTSLTDGESGLAGSEWVV